MQIDFTLKTYMSLIESLEMKSFQFLPFSEFLHSENKKTVCLRHDVDRLPLNSLKFAQIQHHKGIRSTFFFRAVPESWDEEIIKRISNLGHEIGYHYESLAIKKGDTEAAIKDFEMNLKKLRNIAPVTTICMHGSPRSKYDSKDLWKNYDYSDFGIIGEPYFDIDFSSVAYYTDTGRMWDGYKYSVRDKIANANSNRTVEPEQTKFPKFHSTQQIATAVQNGNFPKQSMMTFHPQRWTDRPLPWLNELISQHIKNTIKYFYIRLKR